MAKKEKHVTEFDPSTLQSTKVESVDDIEDPAEKMRAIVQGMITPSKNKDEDDSKFKSQSAYEYLKFGGFSDQARLQHVLEAALLAFEKEAILASGASAVGSGIGHTIKMTGRGIAQRMGGVLRGAGRMSMGLAKKMGPVGLALGALTAGDLKNKLQQGQAEGLQPRRTLQRMVEG
jgi:hypothetical protein